MNKIVSIILMYGAVIPSLVAAPLCHQIEEKNQQLFLWLVEQQKLISIPLTILSVLSYASIHSTIKKTHCNFCPAENFPQLNMFIPSLQEIWLRDDAKEDQLVHELAHFLQSSGKDDSAQDSYELEEQAVYWQNRYKSTHENKYLCK